MSNSTEQGQAATSESPASPTTPQPAASNAVQLAASSAAAPATSAAPASSAAVTSSSPPRQSQPETASAPAIAVPTTSNTADSPSTAPSDQKPPANNPPPTASTPQNAAPPAAETSAATSTSSATAPPAAAPTSSNAPKQPTGQSSVVTVIPGDIDTSVQVVTSTTQTPSDVPTPATTPSSTSFPLPIDAPSGGSSGLSQPSVVAIGVFVPVCAIAILAILGLFWWKKRRTRQEAEEERRKEVEDYAYNPNADPSMPSAAHSADNSYEMREDGGSGYRGWGSTAAPGSMGRKASTMSGGGMAGAYSDPSSPTRANPGEPLLDGQSSPEGEILGAMGPSAANNRGGDMRRGPSNASSSYSAGARSEGSDCGLYGNAPNYYEQYGQNPYSDQRPQDPASQAVIRDNPARCNTRIEKSSHYPQHSAGIAQNF